MNTASIITGLAHDCQLVVLDTTTSTSDELRARMGERAVAHRCPLVVVSMRQTAGRGRLGRHWASPDGGIYLSLSFAPAPSAPPSAAQPGDECQEMRSPDTSLDTHDTRSPDTPPVTLHSLSHVPLSHAPGAPDYSVLPLITALGVREALAVFSPPEVGIKWPNDVLCAAGKLGGILVEGTQEAYVVGVGVNVNRPDEGAFEGAAYLNDMCADSKEALSDVNNQGFRSTQTLELEPVVAALINNILARFKLWGERGYDFTQFATEYRRHLLLIGEEVTLRTALGQEIATGTIEGVNDKGQLLLATQSGQTAVAVGEVTLRNPMER